MDVEDEDEKGILLLNDTGYADGCACMLAVEMESAALYLNAAKFGKKAVALCTISDLMFTGEACTTRERQESFYEMIRMALSMI